MAEVAEVCRAGAALQTLVHQFSDPFSFYRELIQNAVDAGSGRVDVTVEHEGSTLVVTVQDYGEGMNADIIDTKLTRLFSSSKDDDLTRIGRFGIGFVSVFAVDPHSVVVDTARDGENWRVVFQPDRSFVRLARSEPVEGTRIRLLKEATAEQAAEFSQKSREAIRFWCRHVDCDLMFHGQNLREPFGLDCPCQVRRSVPGTDIVVGYPPDGQPFIGFYNRGLTLMESRKQFTLPRVAAKINSRYLEHTLTRDGVVQDAHLVDLLAQVSAIAEGELPDLLLRRLESGEQSLHQAALAYFGYPYRRVWRAVDLSHRDGVADGDEWMALPGLHAPGHITFGPYVADLPPGPYTARFRLRVAPDPGAGDSGVAIVDVHDVLSKTVLAVRGLSRNDLAAQRDISLTFTAQEGQSLEFRTQWHGQVALWHSQVEVVSGGRPDLTRHRDRALFRTPAGRAVPLGEILDRFAEGRLYTAPAPTPLTEALDKADVLVLLADRGDLLEAVLDASPVPASDAWDLPLEVEAELEQRAAPLAAALLALLGSHGVRLSAVRLARLPEEPSLAIVQTRFGDLVPAQKTDPLPGFFSKPGVLVLNAEHPALATLSALAHREAELAGFMAAKLILLPRGLSATDDGALALAAWEARCRRRRR
ncbi:MAG: ATP-binding protein [Candidatus Eremiobacterota bacterium]